MNQGKNVLEHPTVLVTQLHTACHTVDHVSSVCLCRALDDIQESIKELQYYRGNVFKVEAEEKKRKILENGNNKCAA